MATHLLQSQMNIVFICHHYNKKLGKDVRSALQMH